MADAQSLQDSVSSLAQNEFGGGTTTTTTTSTPSRSNSPGAKTQRGGGHQQQQQLLRPMTELVLIDNPNLKDPYAASSVPIYQSATFKQTSARAMATADFDYSRSGNPTRSHLEHHLAKVMGAARAFAVSSGMGALDVITRLLQAGDHVIAGDDLYGGTNRLLGYLAAHSDIKTHHVDTTKVESLFPVLSPRTRLVLLETPTNPLIKIADIEAISSWVHERCPGCLVAVDNTMMSSYLQRPLDLGADIVYDSATKYLSGHHDLMAGAIAVKDVELAKRIYFIINSTGCGLAPFDSWLLLRGIKTLGVRMEQQQRNAEIIANYLERKGFKVHYPGLISHPQYDLHHRMASGAGAVLSFETGSVAVSERIVETTRIWGISVSFGCVNSLISMPCLMSHASIDPATRAARNLPEDLIRLCVGIEDPDDLLEDLQNALIDAGALNEDGSAQDHDFVSQMASHAAADTGTFLVSAPGKMILFGEHAAVHGVTALAASIDLCTFLVVERRQDGRIELDFPDIGLSKGWDLDALPWDSTLVGRIDEPPRDLDDTLFEEIKALTRLDTPVQLAASQAFLYLYMSIQDVEKIAKRGQGHTFTLRSDLPISAGLGSSASVSVCLATGLLKAFGYLTAPESALNNVKESKIVDGWSFLGDKVIHGNPSGIDTTVACHGGAVAFTKGKGIQVLQNMPRLDFLLTDTQVKRDTKTLVAAVGKLLDSDRERTLEVFDSIQNISQEAEQLLTDPTLPRPTMLSRLSTLIDENHQLLVQLGVSHPSLERIKSITSKFGLQSKLTGAGGGGCAITLLPDHLADSTLEECQGELRKAGMKTFRVQVGGPGYQLLSPSPVNGKDFLTFQQGQLAMTIERTKGR